jgi:hypothetical protein
MLNGKVTTVWASRAEIIMGSSLRARIGKETCGYERKGKGEGECGCGGEGRGGDDGSREHRENEVEGIYVEEIRGEKGGDRRGKENGRE